MLSTLRSPVAALRRHLKSRTRGQSLVELALILPVFMLFFAAVLDLGRIAAAQVAVENAAREGAFQAAKTPTSFDSATGCPSGAATNKTRVSWSVALVTLSRLSATTICQVPSGRASGSVSIRKESPS